MTLPEGPSSSWARAAFAPFGWLAVAILLASLLALAAPALGPGDPELAGWNPLLNTVELELAGASDERATAFAETLRRSHPERQVELHGRHGATRIQVTADLDPATLVRELIDRARTEGLTVERFEMGSNLARVAERVWRDPSAVHDAAGRLLPIALLAGSGALLLLGVLLRQRLAPDPNAGGPGITGVRGLGLGLAGGLGLVIAVEATGALTAWLGAPIVEQPWLTDALTQDGARRLWVLSVVLVLAPLGEELFFRGYLLPALVRPWGERGALFLSSLAFALVHGHLPALPAYLVYGLGLALLARRSGSLVPPIVAHATVNGAAVALQLWQAT